MRTPSPRCRFATVAVLSVSALAAQDGPDAMRALRAMELDGAVELSRDAVAAELAADAETLRALRRGLDAEAATTVAERVRELHLGAGYAQAAARGSIVDGVLHIALAAGPRFRCGPIEIAGNAVVTSDALRARLAADATAAVDGSAWRLGEFAAMDAAAERRLLASIRRVYGDAGRPGARASLRFQPEADRLVARIEIADEGHEVHIRSLQLDGETVTDAEVVVAELALAPDALASATNLEALRHRIEATGRYRSVQFAVAANSPPLLDPLVVRVERVERPKGFGTFARRDVEQVRTAIAKLGERLRRGDALRIVGSLSSPLELGSALIQPGALEVRLSRDGLTVRADAAQFGRMPSAATNLGLTPQRLWLSHGQHGFDFAFGQSLGATLSLRTGLSTDGSMELQTALGFHLRAEAMLDLKPHPATAEYAMTRATSVRRDGDVLTLQFATFEVRLAADGEVADGQVGIASAKGAFELSWSDALATPATTAQPATSSLAAVLVELAGLWFEASRSEDPVTSQLVRSLVPLVRESEAAAKGAPPKHKAPSLSDAAARSTTFYAGSLFAAAAVHRKVPPHIADACGAFANALQGDTRAAGAGFEALADDAQCGPLSLGLVAFAWDTLGNERLARRFAQLADERMEFDAVYTEAAEFAAFAPTSVSLPTRVGAAWRANPALQDWLGALPPGEDGDRAAWKKGLRALWDGGAEKAVRDWLRSR